MLMKKFILFLTFVSANAIILNCRFYFYSNWNSLPENTYTCSAYVTLDFTNGTVIDVIGTHLDGKNDSNVEIVDIGNNPNLTFIPQGLTFFFTNMIGIHLHRTGLKTIYGDELNNYPRLRWFSVEMGILESVGGSLFENTPEIFVANFYGNKIENIGWNLLDPLNSTIRVYFALNTCINMNSYNNSTRFNLLVERIRTNCTDFNAEITTSTTTTTTINPAITTSSLSTTLSSITTSTFPTTPEGECSNGSVGANVCELIEQNKKLEAKLEFITELLFELLTSPCRK